jgi:SiaC family regulatory phosphoprotein
MDSLTIPGSSHTPDVEFDGDKCILSLKGRSTPENSIEFYRPLMEWLDKFGESKPPQKTSLNIRLEYFNTSSSKCILDIFKKVNSLYKDGIDVVIKWYYEEEDEDMQEAGEDYSDLLDIPFEIIMMEEE